MKTWRGSWVAMAAGGAIALAACVTAPAAAEGVAEAVAAPAPGALLSVQPTPVPATLPHAAERSVITYRSRGVRGEPIVVSGYALLPTGQPPQGGWPVLAWAHGTTGVADTCAPSGDYAGGPVHDYQLLMDQSLDGWLAQGYAVVATDYQGLGTPGGHPYMDAASQLHTVDDSVRALHRLRPGAFSVDWLVMGHSQGGAAALAVAAKGQQDVPEFKLRGAIAAAPGGFRYSAILAYLRANPRPPLGVALFFPIMLEGADVADPGLRVDRLVSADMQPLVTLARSRCMSELREEVKSAPASVFKPDADLAPLEAYFERQGIERMVPRVPLMLVQGSADALVDARGIRAYYQQVCKNGSNIFYHDVPGGDHRASLQASAQAAKAFLAQLDGQGKLASCAALPAPGGQ